MQAKPGGGLLTWLPVEGDRESDSTSAICRRGSGDSTLAGVWKPTPALSGLAEHTSAVAVAFHESCNMNPLEWDGCSTPGHCPCMWLGCPGLGCLLTPSMRNADPWPQTPRSERPVKQNTMSDPQVFCILWISPRNASSHTFR